MVFFVFEFLITISDFLPLALVDKDVVEVSEVGQFGNEMGLVFPVPLTVPDGEGVTIDIENLKVLETSFLLRLSSKICNNFLKRCDLIIANRKDIQFGTAIQSIDG